QQVFLIVFKSRLTEVPATVSQAGEVESQHGSPESREVSADSNNRFQVFAAGKAMGEDGEAMSLTWGPFDDPGQVDPALIQKSDAFAAMRHKTE
ncbi:MAG: hypothetical protein LW697_04650, partial [Blastopirellula sp.]|nr:hypothetical protein [Blastopirellula sp.]